MTTNQLFLMALEPIAIRLRKYYLNSVLSTHYRHLNAIKQQRIDNLHTERWVTRAIVNIESELRDL